MKSSRKLQLATSLSLAGAFLSTSKAAAVENQAANLQKSVNSLAKTTGATTNLNQQIGFIINALIGVIGIAAVIMLIIGGFRYVFSQGDEKSTKGAKDTILYAIIGIVVALLAFAIVNFVLGSLIK